MFEISQRLVYLFQTNKIQLKKVLLFNFHDIHTKPKMHRCVIQLKDHQIVESGKPNGKQSEKLHENQ